MRVKEVIKIIDVIKIYNEVDNEIECFVQSASYINKELNYCLIGVKSKSDEYDSNQDYKKAFEKGAVCAILGYDVVKEEDLEYLKKENKTIIIIKDIKKALLKLAIAKRNSLDIPIIGITGTAGKTTTKDIVHQVLSKKYKTAKSVGNNNSVIGIPITLINVNDEDILVQEMGLYRKDSILKHTSYVKPSIAIVTNIGAVHLENFESVEEILEQKMKIVEGLKKNGELIINIDNEYLYKWYLKNKGKYNIITFGKKSESDYKITKVDIQIDKTIFVVNSIDYEINLSGECYIYDCIPSIILAKIYNIGINIVKEALLNIETSNNRMKKTVKKDITYIDDTYNSNYEAVISTVHNLSLYKNRKIAVLGSMLGCGHLDEKMHINLGKELLKYDIDILITVGKSASLINKIFIKNGYKNNINCFYCLNNIEAIELINKIKKPYDTILVKASSGMKFKEIVKEIIK